jgi:hypothetical protein
MSKKKDEEEKSKAKQKKLWGARLLTQNSGGLFEGFN